jgi:hypothetical protein
MDNIEMDLSKIVCDGAALDGDRWITLELF